MLAQQKTHSDLFKSSNIDVQGQNTGTQFIMYSPHPFKGEILDVK